MIKKHPQFLSQSLVGCYWYLLLQINLFSCFKKYTIINMFHSFLLFSYPMYQAHTFIIYKSLFFLMMCHEWASYIINPLLLNICIDSSISLLCVFLFVWLVFLDKVTPCSPSQLWILSLPISDPREWQLQVCATMSDLFF